MYSYNNFLRQLGPNDTNIQIQDNNGLLIWTIEPYNVLNVMINNNLLKINLNNKVIIIPFSSINESKLALPLFQEYLDELKSREPLLIDKKIENIINSKIDELKEDIKNIANDSIDFDDFKTKLSNL
jgi:hypothetical protein